MKDWAKYLVASVLLASLFGLAAAARAESCSLELKKVGTTGSSADHIFRATYPQRFEKTVSGGVRFGRGDLPEFSKVIKKDRKKYLAETPVRGVIELGSRHFGYVLDSSVKAADEKNEDAKTADKEADDKEEGGLLSGLMQWFSGSKKETRRKKSLPSVTYDRLYFDRDHDGDLTDEKVIEATSTNSFGSNYVSMTFPPIDVTLEVDSTTFDYAFLLDATSVSSPDYAYVQGSINAAAYREGEITLGGKKHRLVLLDYNSNGRFDDQPSIDPSIRSLDGKLYPTQGDRLYVDPDPSNRSQNPYGPATDEGLFEVGKLIWLDGRFHELTVSPSGDKLSLEPSDVAVGYVSNVNQGFTATVYGEQGFLKAQADESGKAPLPAGKWKLLAYVIDKTGKDEPKKPQKPAELSLSEILTQSLGPTAAALGPRSTMVSATGTTNGKSVEVLEGKTVELPFGPPYRPEVDVRYMAGANQASLGMSLVGVGGEICTDLQIRGGKPGKPKITITADGEIVDEVKFEYG